MAENAASSFRFVREAITRSPLTVRPAAREHLSTIQELLKEARLWVKHEADQDEESGTRQAARDLLARIDAAFGGEPKDFAFELAKGHRCDGR